MILIVALATALAAAVISAIIFYCHWKQAEHFHQLAQRTIEQQDELLADLYKVQARYVVTESDEYAYSDINKRNKAIRKALIYQISQAIAKYFKNSPDVEVGESGREIHSYTFLIKKI